MPTGMCTGLHSSFRSRADDISTFAHRVMLRRHLLLVVLAASAVAALGMRGGAPAPSGGALAMDSLASPAGPGSAEPNLTVGPDGRVYMSWLEPADSGHALRFSVHDGSAWAPARTIVARRDFFVNWPISRPSRCSTVAGSRRIGSSGTAVPRMHMAFESRSRVTLARRGVRPSFRIAIRQRRNTGL